MCGCEAGFVCPGCAGTPGDWRYHAFPDDVRPFSKEAQLARGQRRYRRKVASAKRWQALTDEKVGPCRVCLDPASNGVVHGLIQLHHVVTRQDGGDDLADNLVPVCPSCHGDLHVREPHACRALLASLTEAERSYMIERGGVDYPQRAYGVPVTG